MASSEIQRIVISSGKRILDFSCKINAVPYQRSCKDCCGSATLQLTTVPRMKCVILHLSFWLFVILHWIVWTSGITQSGFQVTSFIHLIYVANFSVILVLSLDVTLNPGGAMNIQNRLEEMQSYFKEQWAQHPIAYLTLLSFPVFVVVMPLFSAGIYSWDPTLPMFFTAQAFVKLTNALVPQTTALNILSRIGGGCLEVAITLWAVCFSLAHGQAMVIITVSLPLWLKELRERLDTGPGVGMRRWKREIQHCLLLYRHLRLFNIFGNDLTSRILLPGEVALLTFLTSTALFCTIRLYGVLPLFLYAFFPMLAFFLLTLVIPGLGSQFGKTSLHSLLARRDLTSTALHLKKEILLGKMTCTAEEWLLIRGRLDSLGPIGFRLGMFGTWEVTTAAMILQEVINNALLLLSL